MKHTPKHAGTANPAVTFVDHIHQLITGEPRPGTGRRTAHLTTK